MSDQSDLTPEDKAILAELLRETIAADYRFPMSPRLRSLQAILDKLEAPAVVSEAGGQPSMLFGKNRGGAD